MKTLVAMLVCLAVIVVSVALLIYLPSSESSDSSATVPKIKAGTVILAQSGADRGHEQLLHGGGQMEPRVALRLLERPVPDR